MARQGHPIEAAVEASSRLRLRPILMTSFAFIMGVLPLVISHGAGAEMRQAIGVAVFSGMLGVTFFGLIFTPVFYVLLRNFEKTLHQPKTPPRHHRFPRSSRVKTAEAPRRGGSPRVRTWRSASEPGLQRMRSGHLKHIEMLPVGGPPPQAASPVRQKKPFRPIHRNESHEKTRNLGSRFSEYSARNHNLPHHRPIKSEEGSTPACEHGEAPASPAPSAARRRPIGEAYGIAVRQKKIPSAPFIGTKVTKKHAM